MDTNHFVLSFAAFMVVVTLMFAFSQWEYRSDPPILQRIACKFDNACRGSDCSGPLPADIIIVPEAEDGTAYYYTTGFEMRRNALETVSDREWVARRGTVNMVRLKLRENGALTITETAGFDTDSTVLATATGFCVDAAKTEREHA